MNFRRLRKRETRMALFKKISPEAFFSLLLALLGGITAVLSWRYGLGTLRRPGPGLYPLFIGLAIVAFSLLLFKSELKTRALVPLFGSGSLKTFLFMAVAFCLWIVVMPWLGYVLVTLLVTFGIAKIMKLEGFWKPFSVSAGTALFIYILFDYWLYIDLPRGILG